MISFESDYVNGAHPAVLRRLIETNDTVACGYGADPLCEAAREKIRLACEAPDADVEFLVGGTQSNAAVMAAMMQDYEGVVCADTGHIAVHEAGAIEYTGHKVIALPGKTGKLDPDTLRRHLETFYADDTREHGVFPGIVYLSHPSEYGTLYSKAELEAISGLCRQYGMRLYLDGARLGYGLMSRSTDVTLTDLVRLCDAFLIGGTKVGALCGEAVVFPRHGRPAHFTNSIKRRGALLAKGRLIGVQFDALFTDGVYFEIGRYAIDLAEKLKAAFTEKGIPFYLDSPTNQLFPILDNDTAERLSRDFVFSRWDAVDDTHTVFRFVTSWSTAPEDVEKLKAAL